MSKQLLHAHHSHIVVAALNSHAYAIVANSKCTKSTDASGASSDGSVVYELMAPLSPAPSTQSKKKAKKDTAGDDARAIDVKKGDDSAKTDDGAVSNEEIQSVCCTEINSRIWMAVSREDKTLSLFCIRSDVQSSVESDDDTGAKQLRPVAVYTMPKRARSLAFSCIPTYVPNGNDCHVIVAGDLSGDAIAFPIPKESTVDSMAEDEVTHKSTPRRMLLGHTASMLTGLKVVPSSSLENQKQLLLTADRDEKVRVSYFPESHITHGYLLGHSAFISAMDAIGGEDGNGRSLCLTGSGDGTVRLWDYELCKEVGMVPVVVQKSKDEDVGCDEEFIGSDEEEGIPMKEDDGDAFPEEEDGDDEFDSDDYADEEEGYAGHIVAVPLSVAISPGAKHVVVARDGIDSIDVHPIPPPPSKSSTTSLLLSHLVSLHKKQTLECSSQPLNVVCLSDGSVLVLAREPEYLLHFQCNDEEFVDASTTSPFSLAIGKVAKAQNITMPESTLERDDNGELTLQKKLKIVDINCGDGGGGDGGEEVANNSRDGDNDAANRRVLHWNDAERKKTARLADQRRKKRKKAEKKEGEGSGVESN